MNQRQNFLSFKREWIYYLLPIGVILSTIVKWKHISYYTNKDSYIYMDMAKALPNIDDVLYPPLYPMALRCFQLIVGDYDLAAKVVNLASILFSFAFVRYKKFFWKEIWSLLCFGSFLHIYPMVWSETLYLVFLLMYIYYFYYFFSGTVRDSKFIIYASVVTICLLLIKYNTLFLITANIILSLYLVYSKSKFSQPFFRYTSVTLVCSLVYLLFNYIVTSTLFGIRGGLQNMSYIEYLKYSLINIPTSLDPFFLNLNNIAKTQDVKYTNVISFMLCYTILFYVFLKYLKKTAKLSLVLKWMLVSSIISVFWTVASAYFTDINTLSPRLLIGFYPFILIGFVIYVKENNLVLNWKLFPIIGICSVILDITSIVIKIK